MQPATGRRRSPARPGCPAGAGRIAGNRLPNPAWTAVIADVLECHTTEDMQLIELSRDATAGLAGYSEAWVERHEELKVIQRIDPDSLRTPG